MNMGRIAALAVTASLGMACSEDDTEEGRIPLPPALVEISGLAAASEDTVFGHDDEQAKVYEINIDDGRIIRSLSIGDPAVRADFEGIATDDGVIYLATSGGLIYEADMTGNSNQLDYRIHNTGVGEQCEVEGLSKAPAQDYLLILCKDIFGKKKEADLEIYRWKIGDEKAESRPWISRSFNGEMKRRDRKNFAPSALEWDEQNKRIWIASARSRQLLALGVDGKLISLLKLDKRGHPQTEGLTLVGDQQIILADEGNRLKKPHLTIYKK